MQVLRDVRATRLEARHDGCARRDPFEVVDAQGHTGLPRNREQMQDAIRRSTGRGDRGNRVFEGSPCDNLAGSHVLGDQLHDQPACLLGDIIFMWVECRDVIRHRRTNPQELD